MESQEDIEHEDGQHRTGKYVDVATYLASCREPTVQRAPSENPCGAAHDAAGANGTYNKTHPIIGNVWHFMDRSRCSVHTSGCVFTQWLTKPLLWTSSKMFRS
eukprot:4734599-Amphidinium_carterae.1